MQYQPVCLQNIISLNRNIICIELFSVLHEDHNIIIISYLDKISCHKKIEPVSVSNLVNIKQLFIISL